MALLLEVLQKSEKTYAHKPDAPRPRLFCLQGYHRHNAEQQSVLLFPMMKPDVLDSRRVPSLCHHAVPHTPLARPQQAKHAGQQEIGCVRDIYTRLYFTLPTFMRYSAICTALRAAPFLIWSPESQNVRPFSLARSSRTRPT